MNFQNYFPQPAPAQPAAPTGIVGLAGMTPAQLLAYAQHSALQSGKAAVAPLQTQFGQTQAGYDTHAAQIQNYALALAQLYKTIAPQMQSTFDNAQAAQRAFGQGYANLAQNQVDQQNNSSNAFLAQQGAPAESQHQSMQIGPTEFALQGQIPADMLNKAGAAASDMALNQSLAAGRQGQQDLSSNTAAEQAALDSIQNKEAAVMGKVPGAASSLYANLLGKQVSAQAHSIAVILNDPGAVDANGKPTGGYTPQQVASLSQLTGLPPTAISPFNAKTAQAILNAQNTKDFHTGELANQGARIAETGRHNAATETAASDRLSATINHYTAMENAATNRNNTTIAGQKATAKHRSFEEAQTKFRNDLTAARNSGGGIVTGPDGKRYKVTAAGSGSNKLGLSQGQLDSMARGIAFRYQWSKATEPDVRAGILWKTMVGQIQSLDVNNALTPDEVSQKALVAVRAISQYSGWAGPAGPAPASTTPPATGPTTATATAGTQPQGVSAEVWGNAQANAVAGSTKAAWISSAIKANPSMRKQIITAANATTGWAS